MQSDLTILWGAIREMHPAYGIYTPADSLQKTYEAVDGCYQQADGGNRFYQYYLSFIEQTALWSYPV
jgi:hypothetical protein